MRDGNYLKLVTEYFTDLIKQTKDDDEFKTRGEYIQHLKDKDFRPYKPILNNGKLTYRREKVKSIEECLIANYLFFNGIDYEYEASYSHETADKNYRQYKPDFTITQNGLTIYPEHFGINKDGKVPPFFADRSKMETAEEATAKYKAGIEWKRNLHTTHQTILIESHSYQNKDGNLFEELEESLHLAGISLSPMQPEKIWEAILKSSEEEVYNFVNLLMTFITLLKSNDYSFEQVEHANSKETKSFLKKRNKVFLELAQPVYTLYEKSLHENKLIDFSDMINKATSFIREKRHTEKFKYEIVDEFQDISVSRYQLLKSLLEVNVGCKLFCVGDDWQSIYRFAGSDIALFRDFEKFFGFTEVSKIETTYRFHEPMISISSDFILKNQDQIPKKLQSFFPGKTTELKIVYTEDGPGNHSDTLIKPLTEIGNNPDDNDKDIMILGRYNYDIEKIWQNGILSYNKKDEYRPEVTDHLHMIYR